MCEGARTRRHVNIQTHVTRMHFQKPTALVLKRLLKDTHTHTQSCLDHVERCSQSILLSLAQWDSVLTTATAFTAWTAPRMCVCVCG